jgi:hypothetical protein
MNKHGARFTVMSLIGLCALVQIAASQSPPAGAAGPSIEEVMQSLRADIQSARADVVAKNLTLSSEQAAKFWPLFEKYQAEQNAIMDGQLRDIKKYADSYATLDDAGALALLNGSMDKDAKMAGLRRKWLGEFQKVLGGKMAVRVMQIDRRLSLATQMKILSQIPLVR